MILLLHLLILTLSYQFTDQNHKFVKADERLIQMECHNAEVPEVCIQCLKSDPRSDKADKVEIADIIIGCLKTHANILHGYTTSLASATTDEDFKAALVQCGTAILSAENGLDQATSELKIGRYDNAEHAVSEGLWFEVGCDGIFGKYEPDLPENIEYEKKIYEELSEAANRIIERL